MAVKENAGASDPQRQVHALQKPRTTARARAETSATKSKRQQTSRAHIEHRLDDESRELRPAGVDVERAHRACARHARAQAAQRGGEEERGADDGRAARIVCLSVGVTFERQAREISSQPIQRARPARRPTGRRVPSFPLTQ